MDARGVRVSLFLKLPSVRTFNSLIIKGPFFSASASQGMTRNHEEEKGILSGCRQLLNDYSWNFLLQVPINSSFSFSHFIFY